MPSVKLVHSVDNPALLEDWWQARPIDFADLRKPDSMEPLVADFSREELDAKLALVEARMDARLARMEAVVEGMGRDVSRMETTVEASREENVNHRRWIVGIVIATGVAVIAALFAAIQLLLAGLTAGQQTAMGSSAESVTSPPQIIYIQPPPVGAQPGGGDAPEIELRPSEEQPSR